jgi:hypothetical protein
LRSLSLLATLAFALVLPLSAQEKRIASDFEIAEMQKQLSQSKGFEAQLAARLNLGDARAARNEPALARAEWESALALASKERTGARADSSLARYADATAWAALASAKLHRAGDAFALLEESLRYASDDAVIWNLHASTLRAAGFPRKAVSAARNAVSISAQTPARRLDHDLYRYALASALIETGEAGEAEQLLTAVIADLRSESFAPLRREAARTEAFEVYSSARGDVAAWVSLLNRAQLRLASLLESRGNPEGARREYTRVLEGRSDDPSALAALARLATNEEQRERLYAAAFEANPFSMPLVRDYRAAVAGADVAIEGTSTGAAMRRALVQLERGDRRSARTTLDALLAKFPANATLLALRREAEGAASVALPSESPTPAELSALLDGFDKLTPAQRSRLDAMTLTAEATFVAVPPSDRAGVTVFAEGTLLGIPFRFGTPTAFQGTFAAGEPLRLTFRILGVTRGGDRDVLLLEPLGLERPR